MRPLLDRRTAKPLAVGARPDDGVYDSPDELFEAEPASAPAAPAAIHARAPAAAPDPKPGLLRKVFGFGATSSRAAAAASFGGPGVLAVRGLEKSYRGRTVVQDAGLHVRNGEAVGLLGPNGAGKTTIFYMVTGLVSPDKGVVSLDGHDVTT
ncbi:MAG: ATP-binding cassette domain-containing protein, partial [Microvirga sp.]